MHCVMHLTDEGNSYKLYDPHKTHNYVQSELWTKKFKFYLYLQNIELPIGELETYIEHTI